MKKLFAAAIAAATVLGADARGTATLQGVDFATDTLAHYAIGPGITHTHLLLSSGGRKVHAFIATLDRSNPADAALTAPRVEIGKDQCRTAESVTSMAKRKTGGERQYLAGINGDFFITSSFAAQHEFGNAILGYPNMSCAIDGKLAAPDMIDITSRENALVIGSDGWWIDATDLTYKLLNNDGSTSVKAQAVNYPRRANELMVYNSYMGATTGTGLDGREIALVPADGAKWRINKSVKFVVKGDWGKGDTAIPADGIVISCGPDYHNEWIDGLKDGDIVKLKINLSLPAHDGLKPDVTDVIGGDVRILNNDVTTTEAIRWINTPGAQYARSLVGFDKDRTRMMMVAVDGGSESSGVTYYEAADLMRSLGCIDALDLDGGGSTALYLEHAGIVNKPRDGNERAVGNALYFVLNAPVDNTVASIRFADHAKVLPRYGSYTPAIYGYNRYGQLVDTDVKDFTLIAPSDLGSVSADGTTLLASGQGCHALKAVTASGLSADIAVSVDNSFAASPVYSDLLIDNLHSTPLKLQAAVGSDMMEVAPYAYTWSAADDILAIDPATGTVQGKRNGTTVVSGRIDGSDSDVAINVTVECPTSSEMPIENERDASTWRVTRTSVASATLSTDGDGAYVVDYKVTSARGSRVSINKDLRLWSLPDLINVGVEPGQTPLKSVSISLRAANQSRAKSIERTEIPTGEQPIAFPVDELFDPSDPGIYPITLTQVALTHGGGTGTFNVKITDMSTVYHKFGLGVENVSADGTTLGHLNVRVVDGYAVLPTVAARVRVYSTTGSLVASASDTDRIELPAGRGIYVVTAQTSGSVASAKVAH